MGRDPIPLYWQGLLLANQTQRVLLMNTDGLFVQEIVINVDNGDIQISNINFVKQRPFAQMDGTTNITQRQYTTVQNQLPFVWFRGIILHADIEMTLFENSGVDTEFSIMVTPARKGDFPFAKEVKGVMEPRQLSPHLPRG